MYPFRTDDNYIRNAWYVGCLSEELDAGPVGRTIMDRPVVFYRTETGAVAAMHGLCPHRSYPLALHGKVVGNSLQCNYHGFAFDGRSGACTAIPATGKPPSEFRQRVYPVAEIGPWIWIWPGDPDLAGAPPTLEEIRMGPGYATSPMMAPVVVNARYMLAVENLMDLTHIAFLHATTGGHSAIAQATIEVQESDGLFRVIGSNMPSAWNGFHESVFGSANRFEGKAEHISDTLVVTPGYIPVLAQLVTEIGGAPADPEVFGELWFHHVVTPETARTSHYFGTQTRNFRLDDQALSAFLKHADTGIRLEDIEAMEAIERQFTQFGEPATEMLVSSDVAAGRLRRRFQRLVDREART